VSQTIPLSPPERFASLIDGLFADIATRATNPWIPPLPVEMVLLKLIWRRLRRLSRQFAAILAQLRAGTLAQAPGTPRGRSAGPRPHQPSRRFGWVIYAVSYFVWMRHYELEEMLEHPETAELVEAAPQLGRVLRPLCQMLAVKPPAWLRRPRAPRPAVTIPPAPDWLLSEPGAVLRPDGSVWMHLGSSTHWRPGSGLTLEQARKLDPPVRIWPRQD
jgi:hypothetical protein